MTCREVEGVEGLRVVRVLWGLQQYVAVGPGGVAISTKQKQWPGPGRGGGGREACVERESRSRRSCHAC